MIFDPLIQSGGKATRATSASRRLAADPRVRAALFAPDPARPRGPGPDDTNGPAGERASIRTYVGAVLLLALTLLAAPAARADPAVPCAPQTYDGARFTVCTVDLATHDLRLFSTDASEVPYGRFARLPETLDGAPLAFAMNAGMFDEALAPIGLHVEDEATVNPVNTRSGPGNFHLKPNGVFYVEDGRAGVLTTEAFVAAGLSPELATQSGPILVIDGRLHPRFIEGSSSTKRRNGVGVGADGRIHFAISDEPVSFHHFARLFRDHLGVDDALFLDGGSVPSLYAPHLGRSDGWRLLGPMIAAYSRE